MGNDIDGEVADDKSGWSVDISADGNVIAIGAPSNDANGNNEGHVRVYDLEHSNEVQNKTWVQRGTNLNGQAGRDYLGRDVEISGDGKVVGSTGDNTKTLTLMKWTCSSPPTHMPSSTPDVSFHHTATYLRSTSFCFTFMYRHHLTILIFSFPFDLSSLPTFSAPMEKYHSVLI